MKIDDPGNSKGSIEDRLQRLEEKVFVTDNCRYRMPKAGEIWLFIHSNPRLVCIDEWERIFFISFQGTIGHSFPNAPSTAYLISMAHYTFAADSLAAWVDKGGKL